MPFWAWIPLVVLLVVAVLLGILVLLGRIQNGRYLRPVITFLSKVPLFKRWFQKASIAALERQNPDLAAAMKKMSQFGEPKTPEQAQRMLNLLTPAERRAYMAAVGQETEVPGVGEPPDPPPHGVRRRRRTGEDEARLRPPRLGGAQDRQGHEEKALGAAGDSVAQLARQLDERPDVLVRRPVVDEARPQADLPVDPRGRDPDAAVLLERTDELRVVLVDIADAVRHVAERDDGELGLAAERLEVVVAPDLVVEQPCLARGCARSRRGSPAAPCARKASQSLSARNGREYSSVMSTMWCSGRSCGM